MLESHELESPRGCSAGHHTAPNADLPGGAGVFMDREAVGALGELVGSLVVLVTLVFLSVQVRQSKKATEHS